MTNYIEYGNIFKLKGVTNFAHGCNCAGAMGKGIALQFRKKYPDMFNQYKLLCKKGEFNLGDVFEYQYENGYIFNLGTQKSWKTKAEIVGIKNSLTKMLEIATNLKINQIALPAIGAGLGGLNWIDVKEIINLVSENYPNIELIVVENFKV